MAGAYKWRKLSEIDIKDVFFNSLKEDYPEFEEWYTKKANDDKEAFTYYDEKGLRAFIMLKLNEREEIECKDGKKLISKSRTKISTLKLAEQVEGNRLGEGAIGIALWNWMESEDEEIYVTVFPKHIKLVEMLKKFGFVDVGQNKRGEIILLRSRADVDFSTPYTSFPFVNGKCDKAFILPIDAVWHDKLFPYSELKNTKQETEEFAAANGITKTYICFPRGRLIYSEGKPILIYRIAAENKTHKSVISSYGTITKCVTVKSNGREYLSFDEYKHIIGNKSVFSEKEIRDFYVDKRDLVVLDMVYNHAFGAGNNVNHATLSEYGLWKNCHPFQAVYTMDEFRKVLDLAKQPLNKLIID